MNVVFGIGIAVILYLLVLQGIKAFYPDPTMMEFNCSSLSYPVYPEKVYPANACMLNSTRNPWLG